MNKPTRNKQQHATQLKWNRIIVKCHQIRKAFTTESN